LKIAAFQYTLSYLLTHRFELCIFPLLVNNSSLEQGIEDDLEVDFIVTGVDTCRIVDTVEVDQAASPGVFDTCRLGQSQITAFAETVCLELFRVDTDILILFVFATSSGPAFKRSSTLRYPRS